MSTAAARAATAIKTRVSQNVRSTYSSRSIGRNSATKPTVQPPLRTGTTTSTRSCATSVTSAPDRPAWPMRYAGTTMAGPALLMVAPRGDRMARPSSPGTGRPPRSRCSRARKPAGRAGSPPRSGSRRSARPGPAAGAASPRVSQPEAAPVDGLDQPGLAQLLAERGDVHIQDLHRAVPVRIPRAFHDLLTGHHPSGIAGQALQDAEFLGRERHLAAGHGHLAGPQVHDEIPVPEQLAVLRPTPPQDRADPGQELGQAEGLDHVVVGALIQRQHAVAFLAARGDHDDGTVRTRPELTAYLHAVDVRQPQVK